MMSNVISSIGFVCVNYMEQRWVLYNAKTLNEKVLISITIQKRFASFATDGKLKTATNSLSFNCPFQIQLCSLFRVGGVGWG
jgi:hypothetical protein